MCNELVYCERLFYLEHVQGIFVDSADTINRRDEHEWAEKRGTRTRSSKAEAELPASPELPRSLDIVSEAWGVRSVCLRDEHYALREQQLGHLTPKAPRDRVSGATRDPASMGPSRGPPLVPDASTKIKF